ncbi:MAG: hypothetical protein A2W18_01950 [Candidatus Muproteobacteria bacterium RBG_16_60_9]|uniref:DNA binding HTH domain-containing protein n=1 Tax=Candidatus Muproteobacteria bacterium RBG_16_60_9 TaxID=1817755 RepID=A0A1F6UXJ3_9PROT|nr:MAG: hypothetical protein A2W18_01950 [Candidatus Muproteobacteria bacterium RBG_16_60_9]
MIEYASVPALVALIFKLILVVYSARSPIKNAITWLFLALLVVFTLLNLDEFFFLNYAPRIGMTPIVNAAGFVYIAFWIPAIALLLHLAVVLSFDRGSVFRRPAVIFAIYAPIVPFEYLLLFTNKFVLEFKPFLYSILRVPGPLYWIGETWAILLLSATFAVLVYGARGSRPALARVRARLWLLALSPMILLVIYMILAHHMGWRRLTFPVHIPIVVTFFLLMTTYATHERPHPGGFYRFLYRLFDLESYLPWSKAYRRKTALYDRIRNMIAGIGDSDSTKSIVRQLSDVLQCPVVLMNRERLAVETGQARELAEFPRAALPPVDRLVVAHEVARDLPDLRSLMAHHKVAAIVPFHPHSRAASWVLLGEGFSEQVYTPVDFDEVKRLFDRLADHMLDEQMHMRAELTLARRETQELHRHIADAAQHLHAIEKQLAEHKNARHENPPPSTADAAGHDAVAQEAATSRKSLADYVADLERRMIINALERCGGNQAKAAEYLGLRPNTLHYKMQRYGMVDQKTDE